MTEQKRSDAVSETERPIGELIAFVREQLSAGVELPMPLFGAYVEDVAEISLPKAMRRKKGAK